MATLLCTIYWSPRIRITRYFLYCGVITATAIADAQFGKLQVAASICCIFACIGDLLAVKLDIRFWPIDIAVLIKEMVSD